MGSNPTASSTDSWLSLVKGVRLENESILGIGAGGSNPSLSANSLAGEKSMVTKTKWRRDVRLAVDLFGIGDVAKELRVAETAVRSWLKGLTVPSPESTIPNRLQTMLKE